MNAPNTLLPPAPESIEPPEWLHALIRKWEPDDPQDWHDAQTLFAWETICENAAEIAWCDAHHRLYRECSALLMLGAKPKDGEQCVEAPALLLGVLTKETT